MKKMIFAISVFVMSTGGYSTMAVTGAEMASLGNTLMGGFQGVMAAQQIGKQADQSAADLDRQMEEANKAASAATAGQEVKPPVVLPTIKGNYPIVDPFANPQYWNARTTQYQASMQAAATNSKIMNQKAVEAIDAEFQQTKAMMQAIGGVMQQGGSMMQQMGAKMAETEKLEANKQRTDCLNGAVSADPSQFTKDEEGRTVYTPVDKDGNKGTPVILSPEEERALMAAKRNNQGLVDLSTKDGFKQSDSIGDWEYEGKYYSQAEAQSIYQTEQRVTALTNDITKLNTDLVAVNNRISSFSYPDDPKCETPACKMQFQDLVEERAILRSSITSKTAQRDQEKSKLATLKSSGLARPNQGDTSPVNNVVGNNPNG